MALSTIHQSVDRFICTFDRILKVTTGTLGESARPSPASTLASPQLNDREQQLSASLMRINHSGEVCAQALYQGQTMTAKNRRVAAAMEKASEEEFDHLVWCEHRLRELDSHVSYLNPLWYVGSVSMGAIAGMLGDRINLGFVAATEEAVVDHLHDHLEKLPEADVRSRAILEQMQEDERQHGHLAMDSGGRKFPKPVRKMMRTVSKVMTGTSRWI